MTQEMTPVQISRHRVEIQEEPEDTPRSVSGEKPGNGISGRAYTNAFWAVAAATQILSSSHAGVPDYLLDSKDMTHLSDERPLRKSGDFFVLYPAETLQVVSESDAEATNRTRLELLARLYVNKKLSSEEDARLAIVTEKVRRLIPRVTAEDFEVLEAIAKESEGIRISNEERRRRLGI